VPVVHSAAMLNFTSVTLRRGPRVLFADAGFTLHAGQKVGLTGANGCGKSSLFAMLRGELAPDAGELSLPPGTVIAHVAQETPAVATPAVDYVLDGDSELRRVEGELAAAEAAADGVKVAAMHDRLAAIDGYSARARAARLLHGLGFAPGEEERPVREYSGGWRMRLNLAQALMCRSDLLLLDEPTNHLDLDAVIWLEEWLSAYPGTLLLISHDRDFLDATVHHVLHIEQGGVKLYAGNYSDFELRRAEFLAGQQAAYAKQQREVAHMQRFVERFRAKATKARQAQSRLKALARMELIAPAHADTPFHFEFRAPLKLPDPLLTLAEADAGYGDVAIIRKAGLSLLPGQRLGLLGPNGAGKSTLIRLLAGELTPLAGARGEAQELAVGYFAQHQLEQLDPAATPLLHLQRLDRKAREQELRNFLGGFGFGGEAADSPVAPFSGGEQARLVLALLVWQRPNLLLLDEPTNHLDLEMRHALTLALQEFAGAVVLVSHDRHLLRATCDEFRLVSDGAVAAFDGDLDDYKDWLDRRRRQAEPDGGPRAEHSAAARKEQRRLDAEARKRLQPLRSELAKLEKALERLNGEKAALEARLADNDLYGDGRKEELKQLLVEQAALDERLAETEERWLTLGEELEAAGG